MMLSTSKSVLQKHSQNKLILPSQQQAAMNMTTLSKKSAEEYKQQVRINYFTLKVWRKRCTSLCVVVQF